MQKATLTVESACQILVVTLPVTENQLKRVYHRRSREEHPDHSKHQKAHERMQSVNDAYALLKSTPEALSQELDTSKASDGTPLADLGKGLGPLVNGKACPECSGKGFASVSLDPYEPCPDCRGGNIYDYDFWVFGDTRRLPREFKCKRCNADGKFEKNGRVVGDCYACKGKKWYRPQDKIAVCRTCGNMHRVQNKTGAKIHHVCGKCKGCGEIAMWNPVLPKGLLASR